jgi:prepilin-type N-terminal cleavage/methylation domain-containing protein
MNIIENRKRSMGQGGFTLIELLVVIAILAILAGVAVFAVGNLTTDADASACKVERDTVKTALAAANATSDTTDTWATYIDGGAANTKYFTVTAGAVATKAGVTLPAGC